MSTTQAIAANLGGVVPIRNIPTVQTLKPAIEKESSLNVYSGNYGLRQFPPHTDLAHWYVPPKYLMLRCVIPARDVYTTLLHTETAIKGLAESTIRNAMFVPRRKLCGQLPLLWFCQRNKSHSLFRWDQLFLNPSNDEAKEISSTIQRLDMASEFEKLYLRNAADTLIIDNWRMLHGRSEVAVSETHRVIERVYLARLN